MVGTFSSRLRSKSRLDCSTFFGVFVSTTFFGGLVSAFFGVFVETFLPTSSDSEEDSDDSSEELSSLLSSDSDSFLDAGGLVPSCSKSSSGFFDSSWSNWPPRSDFTGFGGLAVFGGCSSSDSELDSESELLLLLKK